MSKAICPVCKNEATVIGGRFGSHSGADWKTCRWTNSKVDGPTFEEMVDEIMQDVEDPMLLQVAAALKEMGI